MQEIKTHTLIKKLNEILSAEEKKYYSDEKKIPPVFIAGAPRSGTTLLYQMLVSAFDIGYIDNITAKFWDAPLFGLALSNEVFPFAERVLTDFKSDYGFTRPPAGPHEFGYFWKRWFDYGETHELSAEQLSNINTDELKKTIYSMNAFLGKPVAFKNAVAVTLQVKFLIETFTDAFVLIIEREPLYIAQSILEARIKSGKPEEWFSAKPKEYEKLKGKNIYEQVVGQVYYCNERLSEAENIMLHSNNAGRLVKINYEELCESPNGVMDLLEEKFQTINIKRKSTVFEKFNSTNTVRLKQEEFQRLEKEYNKYY